MSILTGVAIVLIALVMLEGISWATCVACDRLLDRPIPRRAPFLADQTKMLTRFVDGPVRRERIDPVLGWAYRPSYGTERDHLNADTLRSKREYDEHPTLGTVRIAAFGDSHVYCNEVLDDEAWPAVIEARYNAEVLNFGVGGYGLDQSYLRYREDGRRFHSQIVILGFTPVMVTRMVSRYRRFQNFRDGPWFKPRFVLDGDALRLIRPPVASPEDARRFIANPALIVEAGVDDGWYMPAMLESELYQLSATYRLLSYASFVLRRRYLGSGRLFDGKVFNTDSEPFRLLDRMLLEFSSLARAAGSRPVVVMIPHRSELDVYRAEGFVPYEPLRARLESQGIDVIDTAKALAADSSSPDSLFCGGGHYSVKGNEIIARFVAESLRLEPSRVTPNASSATAPMAL